MAKAPDVSTPSSVMSAAAVFWPMISALLGGTAAMRAAGETFLPRFPNESDDSYKTRLGTATLLPAFKRTAATLAAKPFARPMAIDEATVPPEVRDLFGDVDMLGTNLRPFAAYLMLLAMQRGLVGVLVDAPRTEGVRTIADEKAAGARPYFTIYEAPTILGWKTERKGKTQALTQLRLMEDYTEPDGEWAEKTCQQVRVLTPGKWEIWRKKPTDPDQWAKYDEGVTSVDVIPFVFFYGVQKGFGIGEPPLLEVAYLNVEHWQSSSDQRNILHVARVPILFASGFSDDDAIVIGAAQATTTENENAKLEYVEHTGNAIEAGRKAILDVEDQMRQAGAELLTQRPTVAETATATISDDEGNRSILQNIAEGFEESLGQAIAIFGKFLGKNDLKPVVTLFKDFGSANLSEKTGDLLLRAADDGHISSETVFGQLQRMDVVDGGDTWEDELKRLTAQHDRDDERAAKRATLTTTTIPDA
jgi:Domain of unknown function (DUF4055)